MKSKILAALAVSALTFSASAQFNANVGATPAISGLNSAVFMVPGSSTTNLPSSLQVLCRVGANGFGLTVNHNGTNATTTTNTTFTFETTGDGVNYATNNRLSFLVTPLGVTYAPYFTNVLGTVANVGNASGVRLRSIQNTNTDSIFITNLTVSAR